MKYVSIVVCFFACVVLLSACGGSNSIDQPGRRQHVASSTSAEQALLSDHSMRVGLDELGIDSNLSLRINSASAVVERDDNSIVITAPKVEQFTQDRINIDAHNADGIVTSIDLDIAYFPFHNGKRGWSLQGRDTEDKVNFVIVGDGYRPEEKLLFFQHVDLLIEKMEADSGIGPYMAAWSIHGIFIASEDSGIDSSPGLDTKRTAFGSHFNCFDIERLICADSEQILDVVEDEYANYDLVALLVNDERYGGAGGNPAIFSFQSVATALHELGHTFAGLADEYVDESIATLYTRNYVEGSYPNVSSRSDPEHVPWQHWINRDGSDGFREPPSQSNTSVGVFQGSYYHNAGFYRPTFSSIMRDVSSPFGPVNTEAWVKKIYNKTAPLKSFHPIPTEFTARAGEPLRFNVEIPFDLTLQGIRWFINDQEQGDLRNNLAVDLQLASGSHDIRVVIDDVASVRDWAGNYARRSTTWQVEVVE